MSVVKRGYLLTKRFLFLAKNGGQFFRNYRHASKQLKSRFQGKVVGLLPVHALGPMILFFDRHIRHFRAHHIHEKRDVTLVSPSNPCNQQLDKMMRRATTVVTDDTLYSSLQRGGESLLRGQGALSATEFKNCPSFFRECAVPIAFTPEEIALGQHLLKKLGVNPSRPIVTINNKDNAYWKSRGETKEWDHYRDTNFSDLEASMIFLRTQGIQLIRTGFYTESASPLYCSLNALTKDEVDFMDIFIASQAVLSINGDSGIAWLPYLFRKPVLVHNFIPMGESPPIEHGLFIPKLMRRKGSNKLMTLRDIQKVKHLFGFEEGSRFIIEAISADRFQGTYYYEKYGIEVIDNTPEELVQGVQEALLFAQGRLHLSDQDHVLQEQFKTAFPLGHPMRHTPGIVSPSFLKKHASILA